MELKFVRTVGDLKEVLDGLPDDALVTASADVGSDGSAHCDVYAVVCGHGSRVVTGFRHGLCIPEASAREVAEDDALPYCEGDVEDIGEFVHITWPFA